MIINKEFKLEPGTKWFRVENLVATEVKVDFEANKIYFKINTDLLPTVRGKTEFISIRSEDLWYSFELYRHENTLRIVFAEEGTYHEYNVGVGEYPITE